MPSPSSSFKHPAKKLTRCLMLQPAVFLPRERLDIVHIIRHLSGFVLQLLPGVSFSLQGF